MKKVTYILISAAVMLASCGENEVLKDTPVKNTGAIAFGYNLPTSGTRTVKTSFAEGDAMAVDGFQTTEQGEVFTLFANDKVTKVDEVNWTYENTRYWDIASTYVFYAMYPYEVKHSFADGLYAITDFVVNDDTDKQQDVMIAEEKNAMPENLVTFNFNHLLSQVNFYLKVSSEYDMKGIKNVTLASFDVEGIRNTGSYQQTGFNTENQNVVGKWTPASEGEYDMPTVTTASPVATKDAVSTIQGGLLMLPQDLTSVKAKISYRLNYTNGTTSAFSSVVDMASALGKQKNSATGETELIKEWKPNHIYNYFFAVNPTKNKAIQFSATVEDWENEVDVTEELKTE